MGCPGFPLLLGLVGVSLAQTANRRASPIFPVLPPITCYYTEILYIGQTMNSEPELWPSSMQNTRRCENWEVCQETLLMLETGPQALIIGSKGCSPAGNRVSGYTEHSNPPGIIITSYVRFCNVNYCNNSSSTAPVLRPQADIVPSEVPSFPSVLENPEKFLRCPTCLALYSCPKKVPIHWCSEKALRCYNGTLQITGEGSSYDIGLLGCSTVPSCDLFLGINTIGAFTLSEKCLDHHNLLWPRSKGTPRFTLAWTLGLGLLLTL